MKRFIFLFIVVLALLPGCDNRKQELALQAKEADLYKREQELLMEKKLLQLKEEDLEKREQLLDTASRIAADTLATLYPDLQGEWNVTMRCTETTCAGSAVGDTKTEIWEISFQNNTMIAKAISDKNLLRVYSGIYIGSSFELFEQQGNVDPAHPVKIAVKLHKTKENEMVGTREIIRPEDCRIVYELNLRKQQ